MPKQFSPDVVDGCQGCGIRARALVRVFDVDALPVGWRRIPCFDDHLMLESDAECYSAYDMLDTLVRDRSVHVLWSEVG